MRATVPRSHAVRSGDLTIHVVDHGGDGAPLLAVHGTGLVARIWDVMIPYLRPHFRVLAVDRRGHGASDKPATGYQFDEIATDYEPLVRQLDLGRLAALGHSSGASTLAIAAARDPELFSRVAMVDPIIFPRLERTEGPTLATKLNLVERTAKRRGDWPSATAMFEDLRTKPVYARWRPEALWAYVRHGARARDDGSVALACSPALESVMYQHDGAIDLFDAMARMAVPVLIVRGAETDRLPRANAERAVSLMPRASLAEMPGVTHFAPMEDPEGVARLVIPFLRGITDRAAAG